MSSVIRHPIPRTRHPARWRALEPARKIVRDRDHGHVLHLFQPVVGGVPNYVAGLVEGLSARGWELSVAAPSDTPVRGRLQCVATELIALDSQAGVSPRSDARVLGQLISLCRSTPVDVIHAHSSKAGALAAALGRLTSTPSVYTPHAWSFQRELPGLAERAYVSIERALGRRHSRVIVVTDAERAEAARTGVVDPRHVQLVHTGLPDAVLPEREWARGELGIEPDRFVVGWVGRLGPQKRPEQLPTLARETSGLATVVALGFGMAGSDIGAKLEAGGGVATSSVDPGLIYAASDAIAITSRWEGLPLVALEAMRAGLPVVGYDVGGLPEQIVDGVSGYIVPSGDVRAMAGKLRGLALDRDLAGQMGRSGRDRFLTQFSFDGMVSGIEAAYRDVTLSARTGRGS